MEQILRLDRKVDYHRPKFLIWVEDTFFRVRFWSLHYYRYMQARLQKTGWVLLFSILFLYFLYQLCFIEES